MVARNLVKVIELARLPERTPVAVTVGTRALVVVKDGSKIYVADGICPHGRWLLSVGSYKDGKLTCRGHGTVYNLETGEGDLRGIKYRINVYRAVVRDGAVYIEL